MTSLKNTDNQTLLANLIRLAQTDRQCQVEILRHMAEIDERKIVVELGFSGMWDFCRRGLKFSESTSTRRISVARAARAYPALLEMLGDGRLTLCTAADLVPLLSAENCETLLAAAANKSRREVQCLGVAPNARPVERDVIRRVPSPAAPTSSALALIEADAAPETRPAAATPRATEKVLHRVAFTAEAGIVQKLERLQEILGGATLAEVCDRAADLLLDKVDPARRVARREERAETKEKKVAAVAKETKVAKAARQPPMEPRRPPVAMADRVKAAGRCEYVSAQGLRCTETRFLTVDHVRPYALGGKSTVADQLRCYCAAHNQLAGRKSFGGLDSQRLAARVWE